MPCGARWQYRREARVDVSGNLNQLCRLRFPPNKGFALVKALLICAVDTRMLVLLQRLVCAELLSIANYLCVDGRVSPILLVI
jgi:hypothetical protein